MCSFYNICQFSLKSGAGCWSSTKIINPLLIVLEQVRELPVLGESAGCI